MRNSLNQKFIEGMRNSYSGWEGNSSKEKFPEGEIPRRRNSQKEKFPEGEIPCPDGGEIRRRRNSLPGWEEKFMEFLLPYMNLSFMEFIIQWISPPSGSWNLSYPIWISPPSGQGMSRSPPGREFIIQGIYPPIRAGMSHPIRVGNLSFRELILPSGQGIYHSGNLSSPLGREFIIQEISPIWIYDSGNFSYPIWICDSGNFSFREFLLYEFMIQGISPIWIYDSGNFWFREFLISCMNEKFREFLIQGIYHILYEFLIQEISHILYEWEIQGISHPLRAGNLSYPIWISDSGNFWFREFLIPSGREFLLSYMNVSFRIGRNSPRSGQGISDSGNFSYPIWISHILYEFLISIWISHILYEFLISYMNFSYPIWISHSGNF